MEYKDIVAMKPLDMMRVIARDMNVADTWEQASIHIDFKEKFISVMHRTSLEGCAICAMFVFDIEGRFKAARLKEPSHEHDQHMHAATYNLEEFIREVGYTSPDRHTWREMLKYFYEISIRPEIGPPGYVRVDQATGAVVANEQLFENALILLRVSPWS